MKSPKEILSLLLLLILGLAPRLAFVTRFPTIPVSDFHALVLFGLYLRDHGLTSNGWFWMFNPGVPLVLSGLFRIFPSIDPGTVARLGTAFACGLLPILPFLIWRGVLPFWMRLLASVSMALWPGQILFSGVVAQDNWVLLPSIALGALAVRSLLSGKPTRLVTVGLLYGAAALLRQEIPVALFPLFLAATGINFQIRWQRAVAVGLAAALPLSAVAAYRYASTGRFALSQESAGMTILGSYMPGAASHGGWIDPSIYIGSVRPDLLSDPKAMSAQASRLALQEALRRPGFHAMRILSTMISQATEGEGASLSWSLDFPGVLPEALRERGTALRQRLLRPLHLEMAAIQGLFLAAVIVGIRRRNAAILVLASAVLLKYGVHAITAAHQGRYFFVATAWEILAITVAIYELWKTVLPDARLLVTGAMGVGAACSLGLILVAPHLADFVRSRDQLEIGSIRQRFEKTNVLPNLPSVPSIPPKRQISGS